MTRFPKSQIRFLLIASFIALVLFVANAFSARAVVKTDPKDSEPAFGQTGIYPMARK